MRDEIESIMKRFHIEQVDEFDESARKLISYLKNTEQVMITIYSGVEFYF